MRKASGWKRVVVLFWLSVATAIASPAQSLTTLANFDQTNGADPYYVSLAQGVDGALYGTTSLGGENYFGTVFKITPSGVLTTLYSFCPGGGDCPDGFLPYAGLVQATDGDFYGTTSEGGAGSVGTIFKITPAGTLTTLHSFDYYDGSSPQTGLVLAADGSFYGTTVYGGINGRGTVFKVTRGGTLTTLYSFCGIAYCGDGSFPQAGLIQAVDGNFYGTTLNGGAYNGGTVFEITTMGTLMTLHSFQYDDGLYPYAGLVQAANGALYGTTEAGGARGNGTVFKITPRGKLTTLYSFCALKYCADGSYPQAGLIQATNSEFFGTTVYGGTNNGGTLFEIAEDGTLTTLYSFCAQGYPNCTDGTEPFGGLLQATNGDFYGTTSEGGDLTTCSPPNGCGTVFSLPSGLGPFVKTLPAAAKVGSEVGILGTDLTGATAVSFNGTAAKFSVRSPSLILTHVPAGATTGKVQVALPSGTLSSNVPFYVLK